MSTVWFSLRRRLLILLLGGFTVGWLAVLATSYVDAHHEIDEMFDAQLAQTAQALLAGRHRDTKHGDDDEDGDRDRPAAHRYQRKVMFQIWHDDGSLVLRSANAPDTPLAASDGFTEVENASGHWRIFGQWDDQRRHRVLVAEDHAIRDELIGHIAWRLLLPALVGLPLLGAWVWLATRRSLMPLDAVARDIAAREPDRLHAVSPATAPEEIRPLIEAINSLFHRVGQALEAERQFTADAAHELRTPLAALAAQAQVVLRARDDAERSHAVEQMVAGSRRAARLVDQLLTLARLDPDNTAPTEEVRLDSLAEEVCAAHGSAAMAANVALELEAVPATVRGNAGMLRILLRNLVDNAIRYTPAGGRIVVTVAPGLLAVADTGPGIPAAERQRVFDRFHRLAGQDTEGSGLGLSIVARIVERHGARIELGSGEAGNEKGKGLRVTVRFSAPTVPGGAS